MKQQEQFKINKYHILHNKKQYLLDYAHQLQNTVASTWEANQSLKARLEELQCKVKQKGHNDSKDEEEEVMGYRMEEKEKIRKLEELKKLIQQYKFLCAQAAKYPSNQQNTAYHSQNQNKDTANLRPSRVSRSRSQKKVTTKIFCSLCDRHFYPQEYYRHCQQTHGQSQLTKSFRS